MDAIPPAIPFAGARQVASAYGVQPPVRVRPVSPVQPAGQAEPGPRSGDDPRPGRLVGAVVPGGISFEGGVAQPTSASLPMYRHPADKNAAATAVNQSALNLGRVLDTNA